MPFHCSAVWQHPDVTFQLFYSAYWSDAATGCGQTLLLYVQIRTSERDNSGCHMHACRHTLLLYPVNFCCLKCFLQGCVTSTGKLKRAKGQTKAGTVQKADRTCKSAEDRISVMANVEFETAQQRGPERHRQRAPSSQERTCEPKRGMDHRPRMITSTMVLGGTAHSQPDHSPLTRRVFTMIGRNSRAEPRGKPIFLGENLLFRETQSRTCVRRLAPHVLRQPCQRCPAFRFNLELFQGGQAIAASSHTGGY